MTERLTTNLSLWLQCVLGSQELPADLLRSAHLEYSSLSQVYTHLHTKGFIQNPHSLLILDWDRTCRQQPLSNIPLARFGEITDDELTQLEFIDMQLCRLMIVTNQTRMTALIPAFFATIRGYEAFPGALEKRDILYAMQQGISIPGLQPPYKASQAALDDTTALIREHPPKRVGGLYEQVVVVGDQPSDVVFGHALHAYLQESYNPSISLETYWLQDRPPIPHGEPEPAFQAVPLLFGE